MSKKTMIIGASDNPERYACKAANALMSHNHPVVLLGRRSGNINGTEIINQRPAFTDIDTVTLYINPEIQKDWYAYIFDLNPKRVIFNPGTENAEFETLLRTKNIEATEACTLVLLSIGAY
jgi:uncharacterized protein